MDGAGVPAIGVTDLVPAIGVTDLVPAIGVAALAGVPAIGVPVGASTTPSSPRPTIPIMGIEAIQVTAMEAMEVTEGIGATRQTLLDLDARPSGGSRAKPRVTGSVGLEDTIAVTAAAERDKRWKAELIHCSLAARAAVTMAEWLGATDRQPDRGVWSQGRALPVPERRLRVETAARHARMLPRSNNQG